MLFRSDFGNIFGSVQEEVASFIQNGSGDSFGGGSAALSAEGSIWQARAGQAANAIVGDGGEASPDQQAFLESIAPWAKEAADKLGVAPELVSAHAALESGWGQRPLRNADGSSTFNLFGIKAGPGWKGATVDAMTTEFVNGQMNKQVEKFRAYGSYAEAFQDYARLLTQSPRYAGALAQRDDPGRFAQAIASAGPSSISRRVPSRRRRTRRCHGGAGRARGNRPSTARRAVPPAPHGQA